MHDIEDGPVVLVEVFLSSSIDVLEKSIMAKTGVCISYMNSLVILQVLQEHTKIYILSFLL